MKLYLSTTSPYSRLALIAALHSGKRDLQLHYVLPWENPAELIAINPYSQIPALLCDDGNILSETLIIMHYLDDRVLRGGGTCARAAYGIATINQAVRAFALNMHQPAHSIPHPHIARSREALARALGVVGLMNAQFAVKGDAIYILEVNPRASRTVPFVSKATGRPLAKIAARCMAGQTLAAQGIRDEKRPTLYAVKEAVFPFAKFSNVDPILGPEMKSTGEVMGLGATFAERYIRLGIKYIFFPKLIHAKTSFVYILTTLYNYRFETTPCK